jgi:hypothetical protein
LLATLLDQPLVAASGRAVMVLVPSLLRIAAYSINEKRLTYRWTEAG